MHIKSPRPFTCTHAHDAIFLAGGITNCPDWQAEIIPLVDGEEYCLVNPRRDEGLAKTGSDATEQIAWEFDALERCEHVLFWFPETSICPIALFEYGKVLEKLRNYEVDTVVVGVAENYERAFDLRTQTALVVANDDREGLHYVEGWENFRLAVKALFGPIA